jgi:uncharacterized membrane protein YebE (DUF533 family)
MSMFNAEQMPTMPGQVPSIPVPTQLSSPVMPQISPDIETTGRPPVGVDGPELAFRMIQAMISAAYADGKLDLDEERKILERLQAHGMNREEKQILLRELHNPKPIEQLVDGIGDPATAQTMYSIAALAIEIDTETERQWLDRLAQALRISSNMQRFLENMS